MKRELSVAVVLLLTAAPGAPPARAPETAADVETDHVAAFDDGGPRSAGVFADVPSTARGLVGVELDAAVGETLAFDVAAAVRYAGDGPRYRASAGVFVYAQRFAFHGIYAHPFAQWTGPPASIGGGATVGYAWTWPFGASVRLGAGAVYARDLRPRVDGALGWIF